ncbi:hypothetical protein [Actinoplanes couchii]|uniref:Secreted protein n=1 Tax=Actinoplanes couchii TaxID=403638 RepID=A0ABQ3X231_9ACTN|nr:hypothetical protein [Actinoplanes couchii]MDR6316965.1 hypothetical protein [Actinoplanes couchii]GID52573.1 hypothetical protein Aco03nite_009770 [Actinoplanes couchii]
MTAYPYRLRRSFLLVILVLVAAAFLPAGQHHHTDGRVSASACTERELVPVHEHHNDAGAAFQAASRGWLAAPRTAVTVVSAPAPAVTFTPLIAHVDLRLPGVLRV